MLFVVMLPVVSGPSEQAVSRACERVMWKVAEKRAKSSPTHFICIPCNSSNILQSFETFKVNYFYLI